MDLYDEITNGKYDSKFQKPIAPEMIDDISEKSPAEIEAFIIKLTDYKKLLQEYDSAAMRNMEAFRLDLETAYATKYLPRDVRLRLFETSYEDGKHQGLLGVAISYVRLSGLAICAFEWGEKQG